MNATRERVLPIEPPDPRTELARLHVPAFSWALRCCRGDRHEAEDTLHAAYVKVLDGRARYAGRSTFKTWLFGVIRRTALERARRRWRYGLRLDRWLAERDRAVEPDPGRAGDAIRLDEALASLSARQREVLHLVFYQELTIEEAAEVAGLRVGTARTHYERGKKRLRRLLAPEGEP